MPQPSQETTTNLTRRLEEQVREVKARLSSEWKRLGHETKRLEQRARQSPAFTKAKELRQHVDERLEGAHAQLLDILGLASKADLDRLNKKVNSLNRKLTKAA